RSHYDLRRARHHVDQWPPRVCRVFGCCATSSSSGVSTVTHMALLPVDLDATPEDVASSVAVDAAVRAAVAAAGGVPQPGTTPPDPHAPEWACGDAAWLALLRPGGERALLACWLHEFSLTEGSGRAGDAGTDLWAD